MASAPSTGNARCSPRSKRQRLPPSIRSAWRGLDYDRPTKVTRTALQNADSIAGMMLTTEAMIADVPDEKGDGGMCDTGGGMGRMGMGM